MVYGEPADLGSGDSCSGPIRLNSHSVLFQRYDLHYVPFTLTNADASYTAVFRRVNGSRSRRLSTEPALARIRAQRISSWPTENSAPSSVSQGRGALPRQSRQVGPGMAGIGANGLVREENPFMFNGPPISHPPALQPRHHRDWVDASVYNGHGYQPHY